MKVIIANENPLILAQLQQLVESFEVGDVQTASSFSQLSNFLDENSYDLAIIGAQLQNFSTLDLIKKCRNPISVIFTSQGKEDAYEAIKVGAIDYLLEPLQMEQTSTSIMAALKRLKYKQHQITAGINKTKKRFLVKTGDKIKVIGINDVAYIIAEGKLIYIVTSPAGRKYIVDHKMDELEQGLLDSDVFFRINRKYFIHIQAIEEVRPYVNSRLKIMLNVPCDQDMIVSREKVVQFKRWLNL